MSQTYGWKRLGFATAALMSIWYCVRPKYQPLPLIDLPIEENHMGATPVFDKTTRTWDVDESFKNQDKWVAEMKDLIQKGLKETSTSGNVSAGLINDIFLDMHNLIT